MKIRMAVCAALFATSSLSSGQASPANDHDHARTPAQAHAQSVCEKKILRRLRAKEALSGSEYEIFLDVAAAFGRNRLPRLYLFPGGGSSYYLLGSVSLDGKGKILVSRKFVEAMGSVTALKGVLAHEMAHLAADDGTLNCCQKAMREPEIEGAADTFAASKVGLGPLRAFLLRFLELTGTMHDQTAERLRMLELEKF